MLDGLATPWFDRALARLEPRRGDRLLSLDPRLQDVVALRAAIGGEGELTVVIGDEEFAEELAARGHSQPSAVQVRVVRPSR